MRRSVADEKPVAVVCLYAKPARLDGVVLESLQQATSLEDRPFGILDLEGATFQITIVRHRSSGALRLTVGRVRARTIVEKARAGRRRRRTAWRNIRCRVY